MTFTCAGTITEWRAGAFLDTTSGHDDNTILGIWRERSTQPGAYDKVSIIDLGTCGSGVEAALVSGMTRVYQCTVPEGLWVSVQPGDVVGIEVAHSSKLRFGLLFDNSNRAVGPMSYVFNGRPSTITLDQKVYTSPGDQPQISLNVEIVHPTAEANTTTQVHSTPAAVHTSISSTVSSGMVTSSPGYPTSQEPTYFTSEQIARSTVPLGLIIIAVAGGGVMVVLLFLAITLALVYLTGHCRLIGFRENGLDNGAENSGDELDKETDDMEYNEAYNQFNIPTKENISYGQVENWDGIHYDTIDISAHHNVSIKSEPNIYSSIA